MGGVLLGDVPERNAARRGPDQWALCHGEDVLTWGALSARTIQRAHALKSQGIGAGDRVLLALPNCNAFFELTFAIWKLGATPTVVSHRLPRAEFDAIVALAEPKLVVAQDPSLREALRALPVEFGQDHPNTASLPSVEASCCKIMTSGGSTGRPKLIVDHNPGIFDDAPGFGMPKDGVMLNPGPLYHNFPFVMTHMLLTAGTSVVGMEKFDAEQFLALVEKHQVQWVNFVPTMMSRIARLPTEIRQAYDLSSLEVIWHTAAPISPWVKEFWIDWLGGDKVWEMYGGTEGFCATVLDGNEWLAHRGSVGRLHNGEILIRGEGGQALPPKEIGEIYMRPLGSKSDRRNYHYIGESSRRLPDGFESLGDYGWVDEEGYLYIADRRTDLIISGGRNIYPAEVEAVLLEHFAVAEAIVIGLPDEDLGAQVHALVRIEDGETVSREALLSFAAERLISYKLPRTIEFVSERLRDDAGKARRGRLREERIAASAG